MAVGIAKYLEIYIYIQYYILAIAFYYYLNNNNKKKKADPRIEPSQSGPGDKKSSGPHKDAPTSLPRGSIP